MSLLMMLGESLRIVRLWLEMKVRRQLLDELEKIERINDEIAEKLEEGHRHVRETGAGYKLAVAQRLRDQHARRALLGAHISTGLSALERRDPGADKSGDLHAPDK
jgi:hypothetical protein